MMKPGFVPSGNENINYMFCSRVSENGPPTILENTDYPEIMKKSHLQLGLYSVAKLNICTPLTAWSIIGDGIFQHINPINNFTDLQL